jgi:pimeloyl-ACP methyl ester carboxylesterase
MSARAPNHRARVLLIPGGASTVQGYFPQLSALLGPDLGVIEIDPPGIGASADGRQLRLPEYAAALAEGVREQGEAPVVVVGHSLGGLIALRLAVDRPGLIAGLLLLDPTPVTPPRMLRSMGVFLRVLAVLGPAGRRMWDASARRDLRGVSMSRDQEQAFRVYTDPSFVAETARWAGKLAQDGASLAADLRAGRVTAPTIIVSAGNRGPRSAIRRAHQQLVSWIPNAELEIWDQTSHPLHIQQPGRVAEAIRTIATRVQTL